MDQEPEEEHVYLTSSTDCKSEEDNPLDVLDPAVEESSSPVVRTLDSGSHTSIQTCEVYAG